MTDLHIEYLGLVSLAIGALVRLSKSEAIMRSWQVPAKWRPVVAVVLGQASAVIDALAVGTPWRQAVIGGLVSSAIAIAGHDVGIELLRGGRELGAAKQ